MIETEKQKACLYCHAVVGNYTGKILNDSANDQVTMSVWPHAADDPSIVAESDFDVGYGGSAPINYCPVCGRKLRDEVIGDVRNSE